MRGEGEDGGALNVAKPQPLKLVKSFRKEAVHSIFLAPSMGSFLFSFHLGREAYIIHFLLEEDFLLPSPLRGEGQDGGALN